MKKIDLKNLFDFSKFKEKFQKTKTQDGEEKKFDLEKLKEFDFQKLKPTFFNKYDYDIFELCANKIRFKESTILDRYVRNRTRAIITRKVIKRIN